MIFCKDLNSCSNIYFTYLLGVPGPCIVVMDLSEINASVSIFFVYYQKLSANRSERNTHLN